MKVAAIQFAPILGKKAENLVRAARLVIEAAKNGAKLIVLPESAVIGYSFMSPEEAAPLAEVLTPSQSEDSSSSFEVMKKLASKLGVHIAWGLAEKDPGTGNLYNSQVLVTPEGEWEAYRKVNLFGNDWLWAKEGRANPPIRTCSIDGQEKKIGLLICRDVRDKKDKHWDSFYEKGDADIVVFSANWGDGGFPASAWMDFVKDNDVTLVVANRYGKEIPNDFGEGGVCIIEPGPQIHCKGLVWNQDCIVYADLA
jgi:predicted amidohydrolase